MNYTDKELIRAAQIAYFTINYEVLDQVNKSINEPDKVNTVSKANYTLSELFEYSEIFRESVYKDISGFINKSDYNKADELMRDKILSCAKDAKERQMISERLDIIDDIKNGEIGSWKVVSYVDNNTIDNAGMAGKLVNGSWVHQNFSDSGDGLMEKG